jgi:Bifunctional DNA primase/polymerase, N-terminal/Primase C terminal 1 (PriCT-1)
VKSSNLLEAALSYAEKNCWKVLPLHSIRPGGECTCGNDECDRKGKHPRTQHGLKDASRDPEQIRKWWSTWPDANVGVATGEDSGIFVLDVDDKRDKAGSRSLQALRDGHLWQEDTRVSVTGNGKHLLFLHPGVRIKNGVSTLGPGLDIRGDGGYIVAPPSLHVSGRHYCWGNPEKPIANAPDWMLELLTTQSTPPSVFKERIYEVGEEIPVGQRNQTLFSKASLLRWQGLKHPELTVMLLVLNGEFCVPPLSDEEVIRIGKSAAEYETALKPTKLFWSMFNWEAWFSDSRFSERTATHDGWRTNLLGRAWQRGGVLPATLGHLRKYAKAGRGFDDTQVKNILFDFEHLEVEADSFLVNREMVVQYADAVQKAFQSKRIGSRGGIRSAAARRANHKKMNGIRDTKDIDGVEAFASPLGEESYIQN